MIEAVLAVVTAIIGMASGIIKSNAASLAAMLQANQANVDYARAKEITHYNAYTTLIRTLAFILAGGLILIGIIYYLSK